MSKVERINSAYLLNIMGIYLYNGEHMTGITQKVKEDDDEEVCCDESSNINNFTFEVRPYIANRVHW